VNKLTINANESTARLVNFTFARIFDQELTIQGRLHLIAGDEVDFSRQIGASYLHQTANQGHVV
jgi:hypothetical protein